MSEPQNTEHVEVEESTEEKSVFVVDPDDYQKTRKLKAIHEARDHVLEVRRNKRQNIPEYEEFQGKWFETYHRHLAETVASYGHEVAPLIEEAVSNGSIDQELLSVNDDIDVLEFVYSEGRIPDGNGEPSVPNPVQTMSVYRQIDRILRQLGLGLDFEEDKGPAEI